MTEPFDQMHIETKATLQPTTPGPMRVLEEGVGRLETLLLEIHADQAVVIDLLRHIHEELSRRDS